MDKEGKRNMKLLQKKKKKRKKNAKGKEAFTCKLIIYGY